MVELFKVAGIRQGLCSARPAKKMPFGQFALVHLKWIAGEDPKKSVVRANGTGAKKRGKKAAAVAGNGDSETAGGDSETAN
jgi:hypothetical protein